MTHNIIVNKKENINNKKEGLEKLQELKKEEYLTSLNNDFYLIEALERKTRVSKNRILEISLEFAEEQILLENFLYPKYKDFKRHFYRWFLKQDHTRKKSTSEKRAFNQDTNTYYEPPAGGYYNPFAHKRTSEDDDYQVDLTKYVKKRV